MYFTSERPRNTGVAACDFLKQTFSESLFSDSTDAVFLSADKKAAFGVTGLPYYAPVCVCLLNSSVVSSVVSKIEGNVLAVCGETVCFFRL